MCCIYRSGLSPPGCGCCCSDFSFAESHWLEKHTFHFLLRAFLLYVANLAQSDTVIFHVQRGLKPQAIIISVAQTSMTLVTRKIFDSLSVGSRAGWCCVHCVQNGFGWEVSWKNSRVGCCPVAASGWGGKLAVPFTHTVLPTRAHFEGSEVFSIPYLQLLLWQIGFASVMLSNVSKLPTVFFWGGRRGWGVMQIEEKKKEKNKNMMVLNSSNSTQPGQKFLGWGSMALLSSSPVKCLLQTGLQEVLKEKSWEPFFYIAHSVRL